MGTDGPYYHMGDPCDGPYSRLSYGATFLKRAFFVICMRINKLKEAMRKRGIGCCIFYNISEERDRNMSYFAGYNGMGCLVVPKNKAAFLVVPLMEYERARQSRIKVHKWEKGKKLFRQVRELINFRLGKVGIVYRDFSLDVYRSFRGNIKNIKVVDISQDVLGIRAVKDKKEIELLRESAKITSDIIKECINNFSKFRTEEDVRRFLHAETIRKGRKTH